MYKVLKVQVSDKDKLYPYLMNIGKLSNNLYNATLFRVRQLMTSRNKEILSKNELEILKEVEVMNKCLLEKGKSERMISNSGVVNYYFLNDLFRCNNNIDYLHEELPTHTAQAVVKNVTQNIKSFFEANKAYKDSKDSFAGKPKFPNYKHKNGISSFKFSNQECVIKQNKKGNFYVKLPYTKLIVNLGKKVNGKLKEVQVYFLNNIFHMIFILDDEKETPKTKDIYKNICAIDLGLDNLMAVTNNINLPNLLYRGGYLKSINHLYNKKIANIVSVNTKGSNIKYEASKRYLAITNKRNNQIKDYVSKVCKHLINWCVENRIDTMVIGSNKQWKTEINLGSPNNQNFVQIPYNLIKFNLKYRCEQLGINYIETEESYTSKASFLDKDEIPTLNKGSQDYIFSGKRIRRGLYKSKDGIVINADLNGSANIMRKVFDDVDISFNNVQVIKNVSPYLE